MPPRYAYWTIIVDDQPTAFRSGTQEELMPTFKRLKAKNDTAVMMWWQNGKLWPSRVDAQEMMRARGEMGRRSDERQAGAGFRDRERRPARERSAWTPRGEPSTPPPARNADDKLDWKPKGEFIPAPKRSERPDWKPKDSRTPAPSHPRTARSEKPEWKPKGSFAPAPRRSEKADWKPKGAFDRERRPASKRSFDREERPRAFKRPDFKPSGDEGAKPQWKPKGSFDRERKSESKPKSDWQSKDSRPEWKPKGEFTPAPRRSEKPDWKPKTSRSDKPRGARVDWTPKSGHTDAQPSERRKWIPKEEYKKSMGIEAKRDSKWRPGGEHKDPKQKYKDAKKAKWTKFKQNIRARSGGKGKKSS